jgi:hypothetical protein
MTKLVLEIGSEVKAGRTSCTLILWDGLLTGSQKQCGSDMSGWRRRAFLIGI